MTVKLTQYNFLFIIKYYLPNMNDSVIDQMVSDFVDKISLSTNRLRIIFLRKKSGTLAGKEWYVLNKLSESLKENDNGDGKLEKIRIADVVIIDNISISNRFHMVDIDLVLQHQIERDIILKNATELEEYLQEYPILETDSCFLISSVLQHMDSSASVSRPCSPVSSKFISPTSSQKTLA